MWVEPEFPLLPMSWLDVMNFVVTFYGEDPAGRRSIYNGCCAYRHIDGMRRCAFALFVTAETRQYLVEGQTAGSSLENPSVQLVPCVVHLRSSWRFWDRVQMLHDSSYYWAGKGLSPDGQRELEKMKAEFA